MRGRQWAALNLRMERLNRGLSLAALAKETKVAHSTIARLEAGDLPSPQTAYRLATFFDKRPTDMWPDLLKDREERVA